MQSLRVGIREAKINLSKLLKNVQKGREIIITDRGNPVGKIVPMPSDSLPLAERIHELERQGWIELRKKKTVKKLLIPIPIPDELAQKFLQEDRDL
ncbi:MAG: type II toxin-antitoxin system prevent-host-death family antitoxin [Candidatus Aminicenantes bacterium]|nr:type II toxin-antitoxin system prevent-host-death family antitoxin [Candidatus Aminicenantes bacterium]